jgi:hypothetical protein
MENTNNNDKEEKILRPRMEKIFYATGDIVTLKHDIPNNPIMLVQSVDKLPMAEGDRVALLGLTCIWFSSDFKLQKYRFSTKDVKKVTGHD